MNINNIKVGTTYKNWKALCEALEVEPKTTGYKAKQEKDFHQYFNWTKQGHKITITEIYSEVQEREDGRKDNTFTVRHEQESFFKEDELQLAILWMLGARYYELREMNDSTTIFIPRNTMHVGLGLCNQYFNTLFRNKYYYCKLDKDDERETVTDLWKVKVAFDLNNKFSSIDYDMQHHVIVAFNQLQRKKVLQYAYWKFYGVGSKKILFSDEQMATFETVRQNTLTWWNEEYPNRMCATVGDIYGNLIPKEVKEFEEQLKRNLIKSGKFKGMKYYASCYKTIFSIQAIKRELTKRGFNVGTTREDFDRAFIENMTDVVMRINDKFIQKQVERIDKLRETHCDELKEYEEELNKFYEQIERHRKRGLGKDRAKEPKKPNCDLIDYDNYKEVLEFLYLGLQLEITLEQSGLIQGIEHCIKVNKK